MPTKRPRRSYFLWLILLLLPLAAWAAWSRVFSSFAGYDDEGYVMISLKSFMEGRPLYDQTFSQYGPGYYALNAGLHRCLGWPVSHDLTRLKTCCAWLTASGLCGLIVWRIGQSPWWGLLAALLSFLHLERLAMEPGHPQELCLLGGLAILGLGARIGGLQRTHAASTSHVKILWLAMGALVGVVLATKLNLGVYWITGLCLASVADWKDGPLRRRAMFVVFLACCALPWALMRYYVGSWSGVQLACVVTIGIATWWRAELSPVQDRLFPLHSSPRALYATCFVCLMVFALLVMGLRFHGTSWSAIWDGLVTQNLEFSRLAGRFGPLYPWAAMSGLIAVIVSRRQLESDACRIAAIVVLLGCVLFQDLIETFLPLQHGLQDRSGAQLLISLVTPWTAWLLFPGGQRATLGLRLLAAAAILQPLTAFPFPGTQMAVGSLPLLLVLCCAGAQYSVDRTFSLGRRLLPTRLQRRTTAYLAGLASLAVVVLAVRAVWLGTVYLNNPPLGLPGANWMRLSPAEVAEKRALVQYLRHSSDTFLVVPMGYNSLYFWTELEPPTGLNATVWPYLLNPKEQSRVVAGLRRYQRPAIVWNTADPPAADLRSRLLDFAFDAYQPVTYLGQWSIWRPRCSSTAQGTPQPHRVGQAERTSF